MYLLCKCDRWQKLPYVQKFFKIEPFLILTVHMEVFTETKLFCICCVNVTDGRNFRMYRSFLKINHFWPFTIHTEVFTKHPHFQTFVDFLANFCCKNNNTYSLVIVFVHSSWLVHSDTYQHSSVLDKNLETRSQNNTLGFSASRAWMHCVCVWGGGGFSQSWIYLYIVRTV